MIPQGLNSKFKRSFVVQYLRAQNPHIVLLQETHLTGSRVLSLNRSWIQRAIHSTHSSYARGVAILIHKKLTCTIEHVVIDPQGSCVIVVLDVESQLLAIANICPTTIQEGGVVYGPGEGCHFWPPEIVCGW